jgi:hypothetical protein
MKMKKMKTVYPYLIPVLALLAQGISAAAQVKPTGTAPAQLPLPTPPADYGPTVLLSYVRTWEARQATGNTDPTALANNTLYKTATAYYDGLGRPLQTVVKGNSYDGA